MLYDASITIQGEKGVSGKPFKFAFYALLTMTPLLRLRRAQSPLRPRPLGEFADGSEPHIAAPVAV
jgi:hypothetical protein